jgi:hypothetical protein
MGMANEARASTVDTGAVVLGIAVAEVLLVIAVVPINGTMDTVRCPDGTGCILPRYRRLLLSLTDWGAPWNGLNRVTVSVFGSAALVVGLAVAAAVSVLKGRLPGSLG